MYNNAESIIYENKHKHCKLEIAIKSLSNKLKHKEPMKIHYH